jgi:hypothetical protein
MVFPGCGCNTLASEEGYMADNDTETRDGMIKYGFYAGLVLATVCLVFTIAYISFYSYSLEQSYERHVPAYLGENNPDILTCIMLGRTALNKALLQSCGVVGGIAFGFVGFSLFLLGVKGTTDGSGNAAGYSFTFKRLAPGSLVVLAAIVLIGVSANHKIELTLGPSGSSSEVKVTEESQPEATKTHEIPPSDTWKPDNRYPWR